MPSIILETHYFERACLEIRRAVSDKYKAQFEAADEQASPASH